MSYCIHWPESQILQYLCTAVHVFFSLILSSFHSLSISWHSILTWGYQYLERESKGARMRLKKRKIYELLYTDLYSTRLRTKNKALSSNSKIGWGTKSTEWSWVRS